MHRRFALACSGLAFGATLALAVPATSVAASISDPALVAPADRGVAADVAHARNLRDLGPMRGDRPVDIGILMRVRHLAELQQLTLLQGRRRSPLYHHYLTRAQWNAYFAPDPRTYERTIETLERRGFRITKSFSNRGYIEARAPAATVERYFSTQLRSVVQPGRGVRYVNTRPASMPAELRDVAVGVSGLHSITTVRHPIHFADKMLVLQSKQYADALALVRERQRAQVAARPERPHPFDVPTPLVEATPSAPPGPDATNVPGNPSTEYVNSIGGYDPSIYTDAYDYPVQHGYGGRGRSAGSVIEADYLDSDAAAEFSDFGITRTGTTSKTGYRLCADPNATAKCDGTFGAPDPEGEATLDALTIMSMAPAADFYEVIAPEFNDMQIEASYEILVNADVVDDVNSSFGECETDDPAFGYATNYIAMEGAALGISFEASTGDTGATECGTYATNGAPQDEFNVSLPSAGYYFTALGGTEFLPITTCSGVGNGTATSPCYTLEMAWLTGGGGASAIEPVPSWQAPALANQPLTSVGSTTMRNTPDMAFSADELPPGVGIDIVYNGTQSAIGGTSVASPMWTALQVEIDQVQGSRNGWVNPGLYAAFLAFNTATSNFAFRDVITGNNDKYTAIPGYDDASGMGSALGWELAGVENGAQ